jgi:hypothetical protein
MWLAAALTRRKWTSTACQLSFENAPIRSRSHNGTIRPALLFNRTMALPFQGHPGGHKSQAKSRHCEQKKYCGKRHERRER